ncbi:tRNA (adenosine(37)-N6)-dimethylallyltransferase MiaA [Selenomonadales bacterium OttesenSCG-928-I06]|nr:tRNA (adenosine(37)-N6)-dimethylallyltransferase MiaA [Selenomonadales bacterium OttesenSCG-928-I06]
MENLIAIIGPTAVGKTKISIELAKKLNTEIISGDSMLVYKGLNIGSAKPSVEEQEGIVHHLVDILEPSEKFSAALFQKLASKSITEINEKGRIPILAGGTGLYLRALLEGYNFDEVSGNKKLREEFLKIAETKGNEKLYNILIEKVPEIEGKFHYNDVKRTIRALEIHYLSGQKISESKEKTQDTLYNSLIIGLTMERKTLYERINKRVDIMIANGLVEEVEQLLKNGVSRDAQSMQGIGYKEISDYIYGEADLETAIYNIKLATRRFAKRQITWFKKMPYINWIEINEKSNFLEIMENIFESCRKIFPKVK